MDLRDLQRPKRLTARSELREYFVVHRRDVAGVDLSIVQRKELLAMSRSNGACCECVLCDVAAVGNVQVAQLAAVLHHSDGKFPVELRAARKGEALR